MYRNKEGRKEEREEEGRKGRREKRGEEREGKKYKKKMSSSPEKKCKSMDTGITLTGVLMAGPLYTKQPLLMSNILSLYSSLSLDFNKRLLINSYFVT